MTDYSLEFDRFNIGDTYLNISILIYFQTSRKVARIVKNSTRNSYSLLRLTNILHFVPSVISFSFLHPPHLSLYIKTGNFFPESLKTKLETSR